MKIKNGFVLREVAGTPVVLPVGQASVDFSGMLSLNKSGVLLWKALEEGSDREALADALLAEYEVDRAEALSDVDEFIETLTKIGCIE
ncbi:MAG: PqqD family protein [Clostridia bacterium]|nr:PqqD family protein [Clostridia bacterium]